MKNKSTQRISVQQQQQQNCNNNNKNTNTNKCWMHIKIYGEKLAVIIEYFMPMTNGKLYKKKTVTTHQTI